MEFYLFKKPGFKARQSQKLKNANKRMSILVDVDIVNDGKILLLHTQRDFTLLATYLHILGKLDLETESWFVRRDEFENWFKKTFGLSNRFNIEERLEWLSQVGLIEFQKVCNEVATPQAPPLDQAETQEYPEKDHPYIRESKVNKTPPTPKGESDAFQQFWDIYPNKQKKQYAKQIWSRKKLDSKLAEVIRGVVMYKKTRQWIKDDGAFVPHASTFLNQELWLDDLNDNGVAVGKKTYWQRVKESPSVNVYLDGETFEAYGPDFQWNDTSKTYLWQGRELYPDQVRIPEA
jgi:hypothetical protein